jgi:hypothetical protein
MIFHTKALTLRVAKYVKMPSDSIHQKDIRFSQPVQHFFRQQAAYVFHVEQIRSGIQSRKITPLTLLLQKKENVLLYLKFLNSALHALLTLGALPQEHYKIHHTISYLNNLPDVSPDYSLTFLGADNELYTAYHLNNSLEIVRISDSAKIYGLIAFKMIGIGLPLYNNYVPYVVLENNVFYVSIYDLINKVRHDLAEYSIELLEKYLTDYIKKLIGHDISYKVKYYRASYKILEPYRFTGDKAEESFKICSNLAVCETVLYIGNRAINEYDEHIVFEIKFKIHKHNIYHEFSIPHGLSFRDFGLSKTPKKHIINRKTLNIKLANNNHTVPNIGYYKNDYVIMKDFLYNDVYYLLDLRSRTSKKIVSKIYGSMRFYIFNNIVMIVYFTATKLSQEKNAWHLLIYDTIKRRSYNTLIDEWYEGANANLVSHYYIEKCQKIVLILGSIKHNNRDFYDVEQNRNFHTISAITILDLSKISNLSDNDDIEKCKEMIKFPFFIEKYLRGQGSRNVDYVQADCTVDVKKSMLYITAFVHYHKNSVITIAKNLCDRNTKFHDFDLGVPILRTRDITKDKNKPIYTSRKSIKAANFPNYLHRYDWRGFYNFVNSKTINTDLIFIAHPDFLIVDRHYHRLAPFYREFSNFYLADSLLIDDWLVGYYMLDRAQTQPLTLAGLFVINDLTIVRQL